MGARAAKIHLIAVERPISNHDGLGGREEGWIEVFRCRAERMVLRGRETVIAARLSGVQPVVFMIHAVDETSLVKTEMRLRDVETGELYNIRSRVPAENRRDIEITASIGDAI